jgi:hypothetical protein
MKTVWSIWILAVAVYAQTAYDDALFGRVVGVAEQDTLNVRKHPDYRSKKVGALPNDAIVGVDRCRKVGSSVWCKVHHMAQHDYEGFEYGTSGGWVNARYLVLDDRGYVTINGKASCYYILGCQNGQCDLVSHYTQDADGNVISIKTKKVPRSALYAESNFGAEDPHDEGYCVKHVYIESYFIREKERTSRDVLEGFLDTIESKDQYAMLYYISPELGIKFTDDSHFGEERTLSKDELRELLCNDTKLIPDTTAEKM